MFRYSPRPTPPGSCGQPRAPVRRARQAGGMAGKFTPRGARLSWKTCDADLPTALGGAQQEEAARAALVSMSPAQRRARKVAWLSFSASARIAWRACDGRTAARELESKVRRGRVGREQGGLNGEIGGCTTAFQSSTGNPIWGQSNRKEPETRWKPILDLKDIAKTNLDCAGPLPPNVFALGRADFETTMYSARMVSTRVPTLILPLSQNSAQRTCNIH